MSITVETARDILIDTFDDISVRMDGDTLEASDERTAIKAINRIMASLAIYDVNLGFTKLVNISDPVTIPEGAMDALVSILGFRLWPKYRTPDPPSTIIANARQGIKVMYQIGISVGRTEFPADLPRGSGNSSPGDWNETFYPGAIEDTILSENNGSIILEDNTDVS